MIYHAIDQSDVIARDLAKPRGATPMAPERLINECRAVLKEDQSQEGIPYRTPPGGASQTRRDRGMKPPADQLATRDSNS